MSMNHDRLNDYICKLKILSKLEPREKIIIHERTIEIVDYTTYNLARLKKMVNLENRWHMITKLEAMYHDIDSIVDNLVNNPPNRTPEQDVLFALDRLRHDLDGSLQGLHNLILTYNTNKSATSRLETLYEDVKILSQKINKFFTEKKSASSSGSSLVNRKNYGVENVYEESKKIKQINEFDPNKPELQVSPTMTNRTKSSEPLRLSRGTSSNLSNSAGSGTRVPVPPVKVTQVSPALPSHIETVEDIIEDEDDTFSDSPIDPEREAESDPNPDIIKVQSVDTTAREQEVSDNAGWVSVETSNISKTPKRDVVQNKAKGRQNRRNRKH